MTCDPQGTCSSLKQKLHLTHQSHMLSLPVFISFDYSRFMPCMPASLLTSIFFVEVGEVPVAMVGVGTVGPHCHYLWHSSLRYFALYLVYGKYTTCTECVSRQIRSFMTPEWLGKEQHSGCSIAFEFEFILVCQAHAFYTHARIANSTFPNVRIYSAFSFNS